MNLLHVWVVYLIVTFALLVGKAIACRIMGIHGKQYQIGYSPSLVTFTLWEVSFSIGIIVPLPFLLKIYEIREGKKQALTPLWMRKEFSFLKRLTAILTGLLFLYVVAMLIYAFSFLNTQKTYLSVDDVNENGVYVDSLGRSIGLRSGDKILKINGEQEERFSDLVVKLYTDSIKQITIQRGDAIKLISIKYPNIISAHHTYEKQVIYPIYTPYPFTIESVLEESAAQKSGILEGDRIVSINGDSIQFFQDFRQVSEENANDTLLLGIQRESYNGLIHVSVPTDEYGRIGIGLQNSINYSVEQQLFYNSLNRGNTFINNYLKQLKMLFAKETDYRYLGGFRSISSAFSLRRSFWKITSMMLLIYFCWSIIPTPITEGRFLLAMLINTILKLPKTAPAWFGWAVYLLFSFAANFNDIWRMFY